jgi:phosphatidylinositol alpha-1,6-mannosyltransferase
MELTAKSPVAVDVLTHEFRPFVGGIAVYVEELARAMVPLVEEVTVWAPDYRRSSVDDELPFAVQRVAMRGKQDWLCRLRMARALRRRMGSDARRIVILAEPGPIRMWMYADRLRLPRPAELVVLLHGSELAALGGRRRFTGLLRRADRIGVVSQAVRHELCAIDPHLDGKIVVVPGAVRSAWTQQPAGCPAKSIPDCDREKSPKGSLNLDMRSVCCAGSVDLPQIIQLGRIHPRKGQLIFMEALELMAKDGRCQPFISAGLHARLIGPVGKRAYFKAVCSAAMRCTVPVHFTHDLDDRAVGEALQRAWIVVFPSCRWRNSVEGLGLAALEAAWCGCPVVASRSGGIAEAVMDGETGLLVPERDPEALADALIELLLNPRLRAAMAAAGQRFAGAAFSWTRNARRLLGDATLEGA